MAPPASESTPILAGSKNVGTAEESTSISIPADESPDGEQSIVLTEGGLKQMFFLIFIGCFFGCLFALIVWQLSLAIARALGIGWLMFDGGDGR